MLLWVKEDIAEYSFRVPVEIAGRPRGDTGNIDRVLMLEGEDETFPNPAVEKGLIFSIRISGRLPEILVVCKLLFPKPRNTFLSL